MSISFPFLPHGQVQPPWCCEDSEGRGSKNTHGGVKPDDVFFAFSGRPGAFRNLRFSLRMETRVGAYGRLQYNQTTYPARSNTGG